MAVEIHDGTLAGQAVFFRQRTDQHIELQAPAWIEPPRGPLMQATTVNIAPRGVTVEAPGLTLMVGQDVRFAIELSCAMEEIWLHGVVEWVEHERAGIAFRFLHPGEGRAIAHVVLLAMEQCDDEDPVGPEAVFFKNAELL